MTKAKSNSKPVVEEDLSASPELVEIDDLHKLEITYVPIDDVRPNDYNPNRQSDHDFELLCRSIEEDGFTQPILVHAESMIIVDGEHRWRALKALGYTDIPCVLAEMDKVQRMVATLRHNRARGSEDVQKAADVLRDLDEMGGSIGQQIL